MTVRPPETHLFVVWERGRPVAERILQDVQRRFEVLAAFEVTWSTGPDVRHFSRLYGQSLPPGSDKATECGTGPFLLVVVRDRSPRYGRRRKWGRTVVVNTAMFDAKERYRAWSGGARVHNSTDSQEADRDLFVLLGRRAADFADHSGADWDGGFEPVTRDPVGTDGWRSLDELLTAVDLTLPYVLLPDLGRRPDRVRLLVEASFDAWGVEWLLAAPDDVPLSERGPEYPFVLAGRPAVLELHHIGDGSVPAGWQERFLAERVRDGAAWVLAPAHRLTALLHQAEEQSAVPAEAVAALAAAAVAAGVPAGDLADPAARANLLQACAPPAAPSAPPPRPPAPSGVRALARRVLGRPA